MPGFTKLFSEIITSSVWNEEDKTRIVWVTMLASCDAQGVVRASVSGLAHIARVNKESCERALNVLNSPDEDSRSPEWEGRRIEKIAGGWLILNYTKYREARNEDERKAYMANYMREYRAKRRVNIDVNNSKQELASVNHSKPPLAAVSPSRVQKQSTEAEVLQCTERTGHPPPIIHPPPKKDRLPTTEIPIRIAKLFQRRLTTPWSEKEFHAYQKMGKIEPEEMTEVEAYYDIERKKGAEKGLHRRDLITFLNNFRGELDRARQATSHQERRSMANGYYSNSSRLYDKDGNPIKI